MDTRAGQLHFDLELVSDLSTLLSKYGAKEFASPCRSTVPLLSLIKDGWSVFQEVLAACHLPADSNVHFEFRVNPPRGRGKASHTDVMVCSGDNALALEVKWSEPRYETVRDWIRQGRSPENRRKVMTGWLELLQPQAVRLLRVEDFYDAVYQMVHRAASACAQGKRSQLAYLQFTPLPDGQEADSEQHYGDLTDLHRLLGHPAGFPFHLIEVQVMPAAAFRSIERLAKGSSKTAEAVTAALLGASLFKFEGWRLQTIDGPAPS
jgi:hypothetical protein